MKIDALFMDHDRYIITIDEVPIGRKPISMIELMVIKPWLQKNADNIRQIFLRREDMEIIKEMKLWSESIESEK